MKIELTEQFLKSNTVAIHIKNMVELEQILEKFKWSTFYKDREQFTQKINANYFQLRKRVCIEWCSTHTKYGSLDFFIENHWAILKAKDVIEDKVDFQIKTDLLPKAIDILIKMSEEELRKFIYEKSGQTNGLY